MNRWQAMFLFFSVLLLSVKICFFIAQYFITGSIAARALKRKEMERKIDVLAAKREKAHQDKIPLTNMKDLEKFKVLRNR